MPALSFPDRRPLAPPQRKTIILAFDGTANKFGLRNTNVVRLFSLLEKENPQEQVLYYQPGIGRYLDIHVWRHQVSLTSSIPLMFYAQVMDGYRFFMKHYKQGDCICMFGFSRGAYTAGCLAGMLHKVGLLPPDNDQMVPSAYERYLDVSAGGEALALGFKQAFSIECPTEFLGPWDTVASVGVMPSKHLPLTASNGGIKIVRQALALDERRAKFKPNLWHGPSTTGPYSTEKQREELLQDPTPSICSESTIHSGRPPSIAESFGPPEDLHARDYEGATQTDAKEVWFAGCHPDVGDRLYQATGASLSDPSFRWMFNQILAANVPIYFKKEALDNLKFFNQKDAVSAATAEMRDRLKRRGLWWLVEVIPFRRSAWKGDDEPWEERRKPNLWRGRKIWNHRVLVHESVKLRMEQSGYIHTCRKICSE
ncbi:hypothetical protein M407DRAFT_82935 [Tulasnella calospora MUT 4182]|uniref:T6SS Phospholipase effector Tle1-like catalytic domain-containing protein n=1 Tax=Tulasnella calospora MUT 4182 TaxID=1051891 RepID=A0A0C3Q769_9AGAM|nr:hypothetical protein M407DRAFT_82935 [Tulasnella calospora MUT 4182]